MKKILMLALLASTSLQVHALNTDALRACSMIEKDINRLICYDKVMNGQAPVINTLPEKKATTTASTSAPQNATVTPPKDNFGLEHKNISDNNKDEIVARISKIKKAPRGELVLTLENNQVWRQIGTDSYRLKEKDEVIIRRGALNSFMLGMADRNKAIRVKRVK